MPAAPAQPRATPKLQWTLLVSTLQGKALGDHSLLLGKGIGRAGEKSKGTLEKNMNALRESSNMELHGGMLLHKASYLTWSFLRYSYFSSWRQIVNQVFSKQNPVLVKKGQGKEGLNGNTVPKDCPKLAPCVEEAEQSLFCCFCLDNLLHSPFPLLQCHPIE